MGIVKSEENRLLAFKEELRELMCKHSIKLEYDVEDTLPMGEQVNPIRIIIMDGLNTEHTIEDLLDEIDEES